MAKQARATFAQTNQAMIDALTTIGSGKNPDDTDYELNVSPARLNPTDDKPSPQFKTGAVYADQQGNTSYQLVASAARTTTHISAEFTNVNYRGCKVTTDITSAGTGSLTITIQRYDIGKADWVAMLTSLALTANALHALTVYPGITAAANINLSDFLPDRIRVVFTHNNANAMTYSSGISFGV